MTGKTALCLGLAGVVLAGIGCARGWKAQSPSRTYTTIRAEPGRDTEAAREANAAGLRHLARDDLEGAAEAFRRALTADVEFGPAHNNLGKVYYRQGDFHKAAWEFEDARRLLPKHAGPRNNLGLVHEEAGELDQAVEYYREAVGLEPDVPAYRANLARALVRRGDRTAEVRLLLRQVLEQDERAAWRTWARGQLTRVGHAADPVRAAPDVE